MTDGFIRNLVDRGFQFMPPAHESQTGHYYRKLFNRVELSITIEMRETTIGITCEGHVHHCSHTYVKQDDALYVIDQYLVDPTRAEGDYGRNLPLGALLVRAFQARGLSRPDLDHDSWMVTLPTRFLAVVTCKAAGLDLAIYKGTSPENIRRPLIYNRSRLLLFELLSILDQYLLATTEQDVLAVVNGLKPTVDIRQAATESTPPEPKAQGKHYANYLTLEQNVRLDIAGHMMHEAFGHYPYLVGSVTERRDFRDVDIVLMLPDEEFAKMFGPADKLDYGPFEWRWTLMNQAVSKWLETLSGISPIDFKFQDHTEANKKHGRRSGQLKSRSALGIGHGLAYVRHD